LNGFKLTRLGAVEDDPNHFRRYAAECQRLAKQLSGSEREVMLEIAAAWVSCAEEEDRKMRTREEKD
jgi:hypothetical protein